MDLWKNVTAFEKLRQKEKGLWKGDKQSVP